ncbi:MAG: TonB-dependent receptor plug domain-containing protein [Gemmatimonadaceae bacterium]|nr:TonB-dependent receptor plug domain-containing protein [Gemmatimonadaceae bacterium]
MVNAPLAAQRPARPDSAKPLPGVQVVEDALGVRRIPGSIDILDARSLARAHALTTNEALRKLPGLHVRDEEGFGLRPNIGVRGLNPTRSTKVLLLEDGVPTALAPYGDAASYYHPPIDRIESIEVVKGASQILHGPQTVGGVINYITPAIPDAPEGRLSLAPGSRRLLNAHARFGGTFNGTGLLLDALRKQGDGARANTYSELNDLTGKLFVRISASQSLSIKGNYYSERSQVTYSGLTESEWAADLLQNPFADDRMVLDRQGVAITHRVGSAPTRQFTTTVYGHLVNRDWWRQSSNSTQRPNDRSDPACGGMTNLRTACGNEGRLRNYRVAGIEPRASFLGTAGRWSIRTDAGARAHIEVQERQQVNGQFPTSRTVGAATNPNSGVTEDNRRDTEGFAGWTQLQLATGPIVLQPGVRVEHVRLARVNRRPTAVNPAGVSGSTALTQVIPGVGITVTPGARASFFAGLHRGFAPPRPEDIIDNSSGGVVELDAEQSWNGELGVRAAPTDWARGSLTFFQVDFTNQIIPASVAGGTGATLTSAGATLHRGAELAAHLAWPTARGATPRLTPFIDVASTWLPIARFASQRVAYIGTGGSDVVDRVYAEQNAGGTRRRLDVQGNRLPYAPTWLHTVSLGVSTRAGGDVRVEAVHIGEQFGDAANTRTTVADGQQGTIPSALIVNLASTVPIPELRSAAFLTIKNVADRRYIVDRTRGLLPGLPRLVQAGLTQRF